MTRRMLDTYCGIGGMSEGYRQAGWEVVGLDIEAQPNYPFPMIVADALEVLADREFLARFDAVSASPPCQDYSLRMRHLSGEYPRLIEPTRALLVASGLPWVLENVVGAPLPHQDTLDGDYGVELCGTMFGLRVYRHRLFECSFPVWPPRGCDHSRSPWNPHYAPDRERMRAELPPGASLEPAWRTEMGITWKVTDHEGREAIPPCYARYLGERLAASLREVA